LILVVDDNAECRALLVWTLERHGFRTISAPNGRKGVELAIKFQPRLVLMDLSMPGLNGYEASRAIHAHDRGWNIPIVAVSADCGGDRYESLTLEGDFMASLGKPFEEEALLQIVRKVLSRCCFKPTEIRRAA
jgi:CheY-like chemotaxis protein